MTPSLKTSFNKPTLGVYSYTVRTAVEARMLFMSCLLFWDGKSSRILRHGLCMASEVASSFQSKQETDLQPPRARHRNAHFFQSGLLLFGLLPFSMLIKAIDAVCISHHLCHTYQGLWYILTWCIQEPKYIKVPTTSSTSTQKGKQIFNNVIQPTYNLSSCFCIVLWCLQNVGISIDHITCECDQHLGGKIFLQICFEQHKQQF